MQNRITEKSRLLDENGVLIQKGYATKMGILEYNRADIKAKGFKIKEWDYYYVGNKDYGVALTIADNSYMGLMSVSLLQFREKWEHTNSVIVPFTFGKVKLPSTSEIGDVGFENKAISIKFTNDGKTRRLTAKMPNFYEGKSIDVDFTLTENPEDSMVIATPFAGVPTAFYYNQKINCLRAEGKAVFDGKEYVFNRENDSLGGLDWGRGVWTYKNTWFWGSLNTVLDDGKTFGFNIGYGFGDTSAASENMLFYDGFAHKLSQVTFNIPTKDGKDDFMSDWTFTSDDGRFEFKFHPLLNRHAVTDLKVLCSLQNQVFGEFTGKAVLDDGTEIHLDKAVGFAEKVFNKW